MRGCNLHDHHSRTTSGWDMVYLVFVWPTIPFMVHHWPEYSGLTMAINVCSEYYRLPDFLACWKNCWIQLCKHEVWFSEVSSPWTFYSMTWQKSVEFLQRKVETWHENFVNWTLTTYFVSNSSRLTPLLCWMVLLQVPKPALTTPRTVAEWLI